YPIVVKPPPKVNPHVAAIGPTQIRKRSRERRIARLPLRIVLVARHEHADAPNPLGLLRPRPHRPRRRASEPCDEFPSPHPCSPRLIGGAYRVAGCKETGYIAGLVIEPRAGLDAFRWADAPEKAARPRAGLGRKAGRKWERSVQGLVAVDRRDVQTRGRPM